MLPAGEVNDAVIDREYLTRFLSRAIAFPTPLTAEAETDNQVLTFLEEVFATELERLGAEMVDFDEMGNVCGRFAGVDRNDPPLLVVTFVMTHPAASMPDAFAPRFEDGSGYGETGEIVVGRGAGEQKGPLASVLAALEAMQRARLKPACDVCILGLASGETGRHDAIRSAVDHFRLEPAGAIVSVCTSNDIVISHKGRLDLRVTITGEAAHSSSPWLGVNALEGAGLALERIAGIDLGEPHPELGPRSVTPVSIESRPMASHTVPSETLLLIDWRLLPGDTPDWATNRLSEALADLDPPFRVDIKAGDLMYPSQVPPDSWIVDTLSASIERLSGSPPELLHIAAATDSGFLNNRGITTVLFGPGDLAKAHTDADYVSIDEAVTSAQVLVDWIT